MARLQHWVGVREREEGRYKLTQKCYVKCALRYIGIKLFAIG